MRTCRGTLRIATVLSLALSAGGLALASAPASAGTKWKVAASGTSSGQNTLANANTEIQNPVKIEVTVSKAALVQWTVGCTKNGKYIMLPSGKATFTKAGYAAVKVTKSASNCAIAANAENYGTGTDKLSIKFSGGSVGEG